ncbi:MAG: 8-oxoguanine glycosylase ogg1, partial [Chaenotheca gracillima]
QPSHSPIVEPYWIVEDTDELYVHHSSGTSSGIPKPISQTHKGAVGVLPCLSNGCESATFTTTPLYHAGISDLFRAWTSGGMVWLFPGNDVPITAQNIVKSLDVASQAQQQDLSPPVHYFSSVPFVLQMMAEDERGLGLLQSMELVGVGGAALPAVAGDQLVKKGVNLVSRFGNVECGFLLSSHRNYPNDLEWQYLRSDQDKGLLSFEPYGEGTYELVVLPTWPQRVSRFPQFSPETVAELQQNTTNRSDGSFATADLFSPHPTIPNAWKYHSRADSQITLVTGKKFDPAPLEDAIGALALISDVYVFGNGRQSAGALIFRAKAMQCTSDEDFVNAVWPEIEKVNKSGPAHTVLARDLLIAVDPAAPPLEKSSKGTVMRGATEDRFGDLIRQAYEKSDNRINGAEHTASSEKIPDEQVPSIVAGIVTSVLDLGEHIQQDIDLFSYGVDSVGAMEIRTQIQRRLLPPSIDPLPLNIVYDCGTVARLAESVVQRRHGGKVNVEDEHQLMLDLAKRYSDRITRDEPKLVPEPASRPVTGDVVVLTGATGALGAHLLDIYRKKESVSQVVCLVRAKDAASARERVSKSLVARNKRPLNLSDERVSCVVSKLGEENLGLPEQTYSDLAGRATVIIHAAWAVNFSMRLRSFEKDHISGVLNLINLALAAKSDVPPAILFCSSTASVMGEHLQSPIPEAISNDPRSASSLGYSRSKWVAESILDQAHRHPRLRGRVAVLRIGQLCGDTDGGVWNVTEAWPLMLSSVKVTHSLPDLDEPLAWLPVDIAALAVMQAAERVSKSENDREEPAVFHIVNNDRSSRWRDLLRWMEGLGSSFEVVSPKQWISQLGQLKGEDARHPATKLLGLWTNAYASESGTKKRPEVQFSMAQTKDAAPIMRDVRPIDEKHFRLIWAWMQKEMFESQSAPS